MAEREEREDCPEPCLRRGSREVRTQYLAAANELANVRRRAQEREAELLRAHNARAEAMAQLASELEQTRNRLAFRETWRGWLRWPLGLAKQRLGK